jgi:hypothetical protein
MCLGRDWAWWWLDKERLNWQSFSHSLLDLWLWFISNNNNNFNCKSNVLILFQGQFCCSHETCSVTRSIRAQTVLNTDNMKIIMFSYSDSLANEFHNESPHSFSYLITYCAVFANKLLFCFSFFFSSRLSLS